MRCGVKFCGGCNPRFERGEVYRNIKDTIKNIDFSHASEDEEYDILLVIGGCSSCCASYEQYQVKGDVYKLWDLSQVEGIKEKLAQL
ncbi:MAG: hypothetical protein UIJ87_04280 [Anaerovoracaceae bacterium]|nr:hypothetical protein [Anaerovoracaceae bacterium]